MKYELGKNTFIIDGRVIINDEGENENCPSQSYLCAIDRIELQLNQGSDLDWPCGNEFFQKVKALSLTA